MGRDTTAGRTVECLLLFIAPYGIPQVIVSDDGPQFTSKEFQRFCENNGITHKCSPPYHPASNGQAERVVQELKKSLKTKPASMSVRTQVAKFLFVYRNTPHTTTQVTPSSIILRYLPTTRLSFLKPNFGHQQRVHQDAALSPSREFVPEDSVPVLNPRHGTGPKWLRGTAMQRLGPRSYIVMCNGSQRHVHLDHLKGIADLPANVPVSAPVSEPDPTPTPPSPPILSPQSDSPVPGPLH